MSSADSPFDPRIWLATLTYAEIHAFVIGAGFLFLAAFSNSVAFFVFYAVTIYAVLRLGGSGSDGGPRPEDEPPDSEQELPDVGLNEKYQKQIGTELPYYLGGGFIGDRLGASALWVVSGKWPTYYEEIPQVIDALLGGMV